VSTLKEKGWKSAARWALPAASVIAVVVVVRSSLSAEHYFFNSEQDRLAFVPDPWHVAVAFLLSASEGLVLWLVLRLVKLSWFRFVLGLLVFVPWLLVVGEPIGPHVAGFVVMNALWVASIVTFLTAALAVSLVGKIRAQSSPG
jgi:hypothetical protein